MVKPTCLERRSQNEVPLLLVTLSRETQSTEVMGIEGVKLPKMRKETPHPLVPALRVPLPVSPRPAETGVEQAGRRVHGGVESTCAEPVGAPPPLCVLRCPPRPPACSHSLLRAPCSLPSPFRKNHVPVNHLPLENSVASSVMSTVTWRIRADSPTHEPSRVCA